MSPLRPSKLITPSNDKVTFIGGYIQFLNSESTKSSSQSPVPSTRNEKLPLPSKLTPSKDIVIKRLPKTKSDSQTEKVERRKSTSKVRKSPAKSSHKSPSKSLLTQSVEVPLADFDQNRARIASTAFDKQMRLCIEDVQNPIKSDFANPIWETNRSTPEYLINGNETIITTTLHHSPHHSQHSNHSTECKSSQRSLLKNGDAVELIKNVSSPKNTILATPVLQPSKLKQNGDTLLLTGSGNLLASVATEKITLNNYASRPTTATAAKTPTVALNQYTNSNGSAAIEVANFLANPSIIRTK